MRWLEAWGKRCRCKLKKGGSKHNQLISSIWKISLFFPVVKFATYLINQINAGLAVGAHRIKAYFY